MHVLRFVALAAGLIAALGALPASAADIVMSAPRAPAPPVTASSIFVSTPIRNWEGGYSGVAATYGFSRGRSDTGERLNFNGFGGSLFAGYNWQTGAIVYGIDGDVGYNNQRLRTSKGSLKGGFDGALRARLGYSITDDILLYTAAGASAGRFSLTKGAVSDTTTLIGWNAGAGVDARLTDNVFGRAEYRFTGFSQRTTAAGSLGGGNHKVMLGLGVSF